MLCPVVRNTVLHLVKYSRNMTLRCRDLVGTRRLGETVSGENSHGRAGSACAKLWRIFPGSFFFSYFERALTSQLDHVDDLFAPLRWHLCPGLSTSPLTTMADTRRDDPDTSYIAEGEASHEMHALPVAEQIALENLPAIPDPGHGEDGGEAHDIARASTLQTKGPSHGDDAKNWIASANVVVPQDT